MAVRRRSGLAIEDRMPTEIYDVHMRKGLVSRLRRRPAQVNAYPGESIFRLISSKKTGTVALDVDGNAFTVAWDADAADIAAAIVTAAGFSADDVDVNGGPLSNSAQYPVYVRFLGGLDGEVIPFTTAEALARVDTVQAPNANGVARTMGPDELADDRERVWAYEDVFRPRNGRVRNAARRALGISGRGTKRQKFDRTLVRPEVGDRAIDDTPTGP